jgi:hypothetical protein
MTTICFSAEHLQSRPYVKSSLTRLLLALAIVVILRSDSRGTHDHILLYQIRDAPNLEDQVLVFISPMNRVAQLNPQALGSLFVASYDTQGYGGGIRPRLHTGFQFFVSEGKSLTSCYLAKIGGSTDRPTNTRVQQLFYCCCIRCRGNVFTEPLRSNERKGNFTEPLSSNDRRDTIFRAFA